MPELERQARAIPEPRALYTVLRTSLLPPHLQLILASLLLAFCINFLILFVIASSVVMVDARPPRVGFRGIVWLCEKNVIRSEKREELLTPKLWERDFLNA